MSSFSPYQNTRMAAKHEVHSFTPSLSTQAKPEVACANRTQSDPITSWPLRAAPSERWLMKYS